MRNLVIIGNGFDLAHGLKTSYVDFIAWLIKRYYSENNNFFICDKRSIDELRKERNIREITENKKIIKIFLEYEKNIDFTNTFLQKLLCEVLKNNWCDIEQKYFDELLECKNENEAKKLNKELDDIKIQLIEYLKEVETQFKKLDTYDIFFKSVSSNDLIINFNYTDTVNKYLPDSSNDNLIHIHGKLTDKESYVIFGYSAPNDKNNELLKKSNEHMLNIKETKYLLTENGNKINKFIDQHIFLNHVFIIGHSCGLSDQNILNKVLNIYEHQLPSVKIFYFYFKNENGYLTNQLNLKRIINNDKISENFLDYTKSIRMPQFDDSEELNDYFVKKISLLIPEKTLKDDESLF